MMESDVFTGAVFAFPPGSCRASTGWSRARPLAHRPYEHVASGRCSRRHCRWRDGRGTGRLTRRAIGGMPEPHRPRSPGKSVCVPIWLTYSVGGHVRRGSCRAIRRARRRCVPRARPGGGGKHGLDNECCDHSCPRPCAPVRRAVRLSAPLAAPHGGVRRSRDPLCRVPGCRTACLLLHLRPRR